MTFQWLMTARRIGKRLAPIDPLPTLSRTDDENYEVICGVAGCVVKKTKLRRFPKSSSASFFAGLHTSSALSQKSPPLGRAG